MNIDAEALWKDICSALSDDDVVAVETHPLCKDDRAEEGAYSDDPIYALYLKDIKAIPSISLDEERFLIPLAQQGDISARDRLIEGNLKLVVHVVHKSFSSVSDDLLDLIAAGNMGIYKAIEKFDSTQGVSFATYAVNWIVWYAHKWINKFSRTVYVPSVAMGNIEKILELQNNSALTNMPTPTLKEISAATGIPDVIIERLRNVASRKQYFENMESLERVYSLWHWYESNYWSHPFDDRNEKNHTDCWNQLNAAIGFLNDREREIIVLHHGLLEQGRQTLEEISTHQQCTRERIRQLEKKGLEKLKLHMSNIIDEIESQAYTMRPYCMSLPQISGWQCVDHFDLVRFAIMDLLEENAVPLTLDEISGALMNRYAKCEWPIRLLRKALYSPLFKREFCGTKKMHYWPSAWDSQAEPEMHRTMIHLESRVHLDKRIFIQTEVALEKAGENSSSEKAYPEVDIDELAGLFRL